jgi:hypothetical protein
LKHWLMSPRLHSTTSQIMVIFILLTTSTLNLPTTYSIIHVSLFISVQMAVTLFEADDTLNYLHFATIEVFHRSVAEVLSPRDPTPY